MKHVVSGRTPAAVVWLLALTVAPGCAAIRATQQPDKRDMAVLNQGVPRTHVIAEFGAPTWSDQATGTTIDVFSFKQGYSKPTKATRALIHGAADVATLGLWEVVGIPVEALADGTPVQVEVHYSADQTVDHVVVIKGEKAVHPPQMFVFRRPDRGQADAAAPVASQLPPVAPRGEAAIAASSRKQR